MVTFMDTMNTPFIALKPVAPGQTIRSITLVAAAAAPGALLSAPLPVAAIQPFDQ